MTRQSASPTRATQTLRQAAAFLGVRRTNTVRELLKLDTQAGSLAAHAGYDAGGRTLVWTDQVTKVADGRLARGEFRAKNLKGYADRSPRTKKGKRKCCEANCDQIMSGRRRFCEAHRNRRKPMDCQGTIADAIPSSLRVRDLSDEDGRATVALPRGVPGELPKRKRVAGRRERRLSELSDA